MPIYEKMAASGFGSAKGAVCHLWYTSRPFGRSRHRARLLLVDIGHAPYRAAGTVSPACHAMAHPGDDRLAT
jgi:hypothetical protein